MSKQELYSQIPQMHEIMEQISSHNYNRNVVKYCADRVLSNLREKISEGKIDIIDKNKIVKNIISSCENFMQGSIKKVINATGIVIHTNLGRSPLSEDLLRKSMETICGYSNLEYNIDEGSRGDRYHHLSEYLRYLTGAEDALILNNNAAVVFLILNTFAENRECVVSRGELVEIGGSFRIPEVMRKSGTKLQEVGTTNKTKISDYENAVNPEASVIMKVHKSNYVIKGFTEETPCEQICQLANRNDLISYYDLGSGSISDFSLKFCKEPSVKDVIDKGFDLVSFSGDKLLGGVQAGIVAGKKHLIDRLKKNQLMRMLRVDKITLSLLQNTLKEYINEDYDQIRTLKMFNESLDSLKSRADDLARCINETNPDLSLETVQVTSFTGGGSCPMQEMDSYAVQLNTGNISEAEIEKHLRHFTPPVICRTAKKKIIFDLRTIFKEEYEDIAGGINWAVKMSS